MKKRYPVKIAALLGVICLLVSIFSMFAKAFTEDQGAVRGNFYEVMFGLIDGTSVVLLLVVGFVLLCLALIACLFGLSLTDKGTKAFAIVLIVLAAAGGTLCLFSIPFYTAANGIVDINNTGVTTLGPGSIVPAVFAYLAVLIGLYLLLKKKEA